MCVHNQPATGKILIWFDLNQPDLVSTRDGRGLILKWRLTVHADLSTATMRASAVDQRVGKGHMHEDPDFPANCLGPVIKKPAYTGSGVRMLCADMCIDTAGNDIVVQVEVETSPGRTREV